MPRNKLLTQTGKYPEELTTPEREELVKATPAFQKHTRAIRPENENDSVSYKSKKRASKSTALFLNECLKRDVLFNGKDRLYSNIEDLKNACIEFVAFCVENEFAMNLDSLATWLGVSTEFLRMAIRNGSIDERFAVLKSVRQIMDTVLANEMMNYEGNGTSKMFVAKCRMDWQENPTTVNVNISSVGGGQTPGDILSLINNTPVDVDYVNADEPENLENLG